MSGITRLNFSLRARLPLVHQTEAAECGLACLAMVAGYHGHRMDIATLRRRHAISLKGSTLADLMRIAADLELSPRALRLEAVDLPRLRLPAILHWDLNHFVVLRELCGNGVTIHDPARGERSLALNEFSRHFTGVALELAPTVRFRPREERRRLRLRDLLGGIGQLVPAFSQVLALSLALQLFMLAAPWFMQLVVDHVLLSADTDLLTVLGFGFALLVLLQAGTSALRGWIIQYIAVHLSLQVLSNLFRHLLDLPMAFFLKRHVGDLVSRLASADHVQQTLTTRFIAAIVDGVMVVAALAVMSFYSLPLAGIVMAFTATYATLRWALFGRFRRATEEQIVRAARKDSNLLESVRGVQSLRLFEREPERHSRYQNLLVGKLNADIRIARLGIAFEAANAMLFGLEHVVVIWAGALAILDGALSAGMLLAFVAYRGHFSRAVATLIETLVEYRMLGLHLERVGDIALTESVVQPKRGLASAVDVSGHLLIKNLAFAYAPGETPVLRDLGFEVRAGECVAIAGPSGCGKTTLMKILLGLMSPTEGHVLLDDIDVHGNGMHVLRENAAAVMQDDHLFAGSIADNISFFDDQPDSQRIVLYAQAAAIHDEILAMPMGYETLVGDMGTTLSGGQKQRVLLARALYRRPKLLFLDEATSHLDAEREKKVNAAIRGMEITRIIIAHREETLALADRVITLGASNSLAGRERASMETSGM